MSSFDYNAANSDFADHFRHFLSLPGSARQTKAGLITLDPSTGDQSFTGVGFEPDALLIFGVLLDAANEDVFEDDGVLHVGMATATDQWAGGGHAEYQGVTDARFSCWQDDAIIAATWLGVIEVEASLSSFDADGFTLNVSNAMSVDSGAGGNDIELVYFAMKGQGGYACGTAQGLTGTGTQAISGLGFQPAAVFFASTQRPSLGVGSDHFRMMLGGGDANGSFAAWSGSKSGDVYTDSVAYSGACLLFMEDADGGGPFQPVTQAEAELQSLDADGFTLDWNVADGTGRYYSWFAVEEGEIGRWVYNDSANKPVPIAEASKGLLFFMNDRGVDTRDDGHNDPTGTYGATLAIGVCDQDLSGQYIAGYQDISEPDFFVPQSSREILKSGDAFGAYDQKQGGLLASNDVSNRGHIIALGFKAWVPQIYRRALP